MSGAQHTPGAEATSSAEPDGMLAYALARANPNRDDPTWPLPSFDARDWASAFCEIAAKNGHVGIDEGWMVGWFANALMRGFDEANDRSAAPDMLMALRTILGALDDPTGGQHVADMRAASEVARAAIAKATNQGGGA